MLTGVFPFFQSNDDQDALIEISILFGKRKMKELGYTLGRTFETNIESIGDGWQWEELVGHLRPGYSVDPLAFDFLRGLLMLDGKKRSTATQALYHEWLRDSNSD